MRSCNADSYKKGGYLRRGRQCVIRAGGVYCGKEVEMKGMKTKLALTAFLFLAVLGIAGPGMQTDVRAATVTGKEWTTPEDVRVGQTDARSLVIPFNDVESAKKNPTLRLGKNSPNYIDLDGTWKFYWVSKPADKPDVEGVTSIPENYFDITVPSSWQTNMQYAGWKGDEIDWPIYNNQDYPWEASGNGVAKQSRGDGSAAPSAYNPVGTYMRTVNIDEKDIGKRFVITFLGVESGYYLYVNGEAVGYDEDSFTTGEFDITDYLHAGENLITVQVYHYTTGSYLENQDMIYYAGIHRDVYITMQPKVSIYDYNVETTFQSHDYSAANLELKVDVSNTSDADAVRRVRAYLYDDQGEAVSSVNGLEAEVRPAAGQKAAAEFKAVIQNPKLWSAELPNLYTLVMELCDSEGNTLQTVGKRVGFREFYIEGTSASSEMRINGQNIEFYGVNRGEADPRGGHYVPYETIVKDVQNAKQLNLNAIRTSHYPPDPNLIELADEYGLYIMDEVNVESHNARTMSIPTDAQYEKSSGRIFPGNDKRYTNAMVDRMTSMVMRDKNNASVIIYSLGNEAGTDVSDRLAPDPQEGNFNRMIDVIKALDSEKLIHYQGWVGNQRVDINGAMYPKYNPSITDKPYIMMEYQHSMGNTGGDFEQYTDGFEASARYQGGFIWDYVDQSAYTPKDGKGGSGLTEDDLYFGFDGSWKQNSADLNFCVNGFIFPDRTWSPQAYEIKYRYQDLKFAQTDEQRAEKKFTIRNFNRFKNANYYEITWTVLEDGKAIQTETFTDAEVDLAPPVGSISGASTKEVTVPYEITDPKEGAEYLLQIEYKLKNDMVYADKGYVQGSEQFAIDVKGADKIVDLAKLSEIQTDNGAEEVTLTGTTEEGKPFTVKVNKETGLLTTYQVDGKDLISRAPVGSFFRGETDQNAAIGGTGWTTKGEAYDGWYEQGENMTDVSVKVSSVIPQMTKISVNAKLQNGSDYATTYSIYGNGTIVVTAKLTPSDTAPSQLGEFGMWMQVPKEYENLSWYGRGPSETYWNRKYGNMIGVWDNTTVTDQFVPYLRLQEGGNKTDVRWMALTNDEGEGLLASMTYGEGYTGDALEAVALHYSAAALSTHRTGNRYPWQAKATDDVVLRLLTHQKGVGNVNWSSEPVSAVINKNNSELLSYSYTLMPLAKGTDPMEKSKEILGELPDIPTITSIGFGDKIVSGFQADKAEYTIELPTAFEGLPIVTAKGPSSLDITYSQVTEVPGTAVITVNYTDPSTGLKSETEYKVHFKEGGALEQPLSTLVSIPTMAGETPLIRPENNRLLYAYSGYAGIYQNQNQNGGALTTGPADLQTVYNTGFAGNTEQIMDIDISGCNAVSFQGVGGIDWLMKGGNSKSTIKFEVWAHKDVSMLTKEYYENEENIDPTKNSRGTADWTATGWVKLAESGQIVGNAENPKYAFANVPLTYEDGDTTESYQAIRLVMDVSNGSNSHDQGVWGDPAILSAPAQHPGSGFEDPEADRVEIMVNGLALEGFDPEQKEYNVTLSYGAKLPEVSAYVCENGAEIPVNVSEISGLPGTVTVSYDNGTPASYTIHFTRDNAITGSSAYLSDVVDIPALSGPASARNGNLLYAYAQDGAIYTDGSADAKLSLRKSGRRTADADDTVIMTYEHGFAGKAQQIIDIDISSQHAGIFRSDVGVDWALKPDTGNESAEGPTVQFEVWAHKDISQLDYGAEQTDYEKAGWVKLAVSPVMSNWDYSGTQEVQRDLYSFNVDLTYLEGTETKSYEALRLVMNSADGSSADDQGVWGDPRIDFIQEEEPLMAKPILDDNKIETDSNGVSVPVLLNNIDTSADKVFNIILAAYDADNRMAGYTMRSYNAKETGANVDETVTVNYDVDAAGETTLAFMTWYGDEPIEPVFGVFTKKGNGGFEYTKLSFVNEVSENPQAVLSIDADADTVTVTGTGFQPNSTLTLQAFYENEGKLDHAAQVVCDQSGNFSYIYTSGYDLNAESYLDVTVGGQGLTASVKATTRTSADQGRSSVTNRAGTAVCNDRVIDLAKVNGLFIFDENAGTARYSVEAGGSGEAVMAEDDQTLTVTKPGTIRIGAVTAPTATHASGAKVIAVLKVNNNSDRAGLRGAIALAEGKERTDYTAESWTRLQTALEAAKAVAADVNALQKKIDAAEAALLKAICQLVPEDGAKAADLDVLLAAIALAESKNEEDYTAESWANLQTVLSLAKKLNENSDAKEIEETADILIAVLEGLELQLARTYMQDFNASADIPEGWGNLQYSTGMLGVKAISNAPAGYPESVDGNALNASGSGNGTRGARVAYSEYSIPKQTVFDFDFYIKPVAKSIPSMLYLEDGVPLKPANDATVKDLSYSFFAVANGMTKDKTLQYYDFDAETWVDIPGGSGKWLHAQVNVDFSASQVSFTITDGDNVLAEVTKDACLTFPNTVTTFNRITMASYRGSGKTDCDIWLDNFNITGIFSSGAVRVTEVTAEKDTITVAKGTSLDEVKAELAKLAFEARVQDGVIPTPVNDASIWEIENYDGDREGSYKASAAVALPEGFEWATGAADTVEVTVTVAAAEAPITGIKVADAEKELKIGEAYTIEAVIVPSETTDDRALVYTSDNEEAAVVDENGVVTAIAEGSAVITVASAVRPEIKAAVVITVVRSAPSEEELAEALKAVKEAKEAAEAAKAEAEEAAKAAAESQAKAESAESAAKQAAQDAKTAQEKAEAAQARAEQAQKAAEDAAKAAKEDAAAAAEAREKAEIAQAAADQAKEEAEAAAAEAKNAEQAAKDAQAAAETAKTGAQTAQSKAETAAAEAEKAQKAVEDDAKDAKEAKEAAIAAREAAQNAKADAVSAKNAAVDAKRDAEDAMNAAKASQSAAEAAAASAKAQVKLAEAAKAAAAAAADKAIAAQKAAEEAAKRAEAARKAAEETLKKAQAEAEAKLAEAQKVLEEARKLREEVKERIAAEEFKRSRVRIKSVKAGKKKAKVSWKKIEGAEGYVIQYAVRANFKGAKKVTVKSGTAASKRIRKLASKKTYYVRVKAYRTVDGKTIYTKNSVKKKVRVK